LIEEESAGSSCDAENKIFDGKVADVLLLIRYKALFWAFVKTGKIQKQIV